VDKEACLIWQIALDTPLRRVFDYLPAAPHGGPGAPSPPPGVRVRVPFGRRRLIGILVGTRETSTLRREQLKRADAVLDEIPVFDPVTLELLIGAAEYYHHPLGEVLAAALPKALRAGEPQQRPVLPRYRVSASGRNELAHPSDRRAPRQRALLALLLEQGPLARPDLPPGFAPEHLRSIAARGWVETEAPAPATSARPAAATATAPAPAPALAPTPDTPALAVRPGAIALNAAQGAAVAHIEAALGRFEAFVLNGVTGSGKTEVYLTAISTALARGGQVLVLVPEIALTPQLIGRFLARFSTGVVAMHSALTDSARREAWRAAHAGTARIVIGTRSAVFSSLPELALVVVDEEHDASYKQHEGFHYSARDLAVWRAQRANVPIVLGSATPSLETLENVIEGRYIELALPERVGEAQPPVLTLVDLRQHAIESGLSQPVLEAIRRHLGAGGQVIVFLNRRGYAPTLFCNACGWIAACDHCDARMTLHRRAEVLRCHHCGARAPIPTRCGRCQQPLQPVGQGTERVEETLTRFFPDAPLARLDRDTVPSHAELTGVLERVARGEARMLVGTQMLTKGHHFPDVSLVVILDADQGLFASDFRATERLAQTITQVAGRAGRAARRGEVLIQTSYPEHPLLRQLLTRGYAGFATAALEERRAAHWPPFSRLALLRAEARDARKLDEFLRAAAARGRGAGGWWMGAEDSAGSDARGAVRILGPAAAVIARRADHYRAHLLIETGSRAALKRFLARWLDDIETLRGPPGLRWSLDVDPLEVD
jgi:primosomal protein N' (replication factor Y)